MNVVLLILNFDRGCFYGEPSPAAEIGTPGKPGNGPARWLERRWRSWQARLAEAEGHAGRIYQMAERWLQRFVAADEAMLCSFRNDPPARLLHPPSISADDAREYWRHYLARERRRHWIWFSFNLAILPGAILLAALPGPNVVGFWFGYRVASHGLALSGIRQARTRLPRLDTESRECLENRLSDATHTDPEALSRIEAACGLEHLRAHLERVARRPRHADVIRLNAKPPAA